MCKCDRRQVALVSLYQDFAKLFLCSRYIAMAQQERPPHLPVLEHDGVIGP